MSTSGRTQDKTDLLIDVLIVIALQDSFDRTIRLWSLAAALRGDGGPCLAAIIPGRSGWAAYTADGRYKLGGDATGLFGLTAGLCRFEPGERDAYTDAVDQLWRGHRRGRAEPHPPARKALIPPRVREARSRRRVRCVRVRGLARSRHQWAQYLTQLA